ncbi:CBS domain-containing protein [Mesoaciditoga sp.]
MKKLFPATIDGLGSGIAYKRLNPSASIFLVGEANRLLKSFPQFKETKIIKEGMPTTFKCKSLSCTSTFVLEMKRKKIIPNYEDARLFTWAIYLATKAFTDLKTSLLDLEAFYFCAEHGGSLEGISVQISTTKNSRLANEIMTRPVKSVKLSENVSEIMEIIRRTGFSGFPVTDKNGKCVGVVTKKDVERALKAGIEDLQLVMSIPPVMVKENSTLDEIGELMASHDVGRIIVVNEKTQPVGIVTRRDLVRAVVSLGEKSELTFDVSEEMKEKISPFLFSLLEEIGQFANKRNEKAYSVGGFVRDFLMGKESLDVDIVVEGNGIEFVREFAKQKKVRLRLHDEFKTATLFVDGISLDVATARTEYYENPGALPKVESSNLRKDLYRRDFTINAMAIALNPNDFGTLIDFFGGRKDLKNKKIRVLHSMSFIEDPTRILRALRYAARFGYTLEEKTDLLLKDAVKKKYLNVLSEKRIRNELEKSLNVAFPEKIFEKFQKYGIFDIFPCKRKVDFHRYFEIVRKMEENLNTFYSIILLLLKPCKRKVLEEIFEKYGIPKKFLDVFEKLYSSNLLKEIEKSDRPSSIFFALEKVQKEALPILAYESEKVREKVFLFLKKYKESKLEKVNGDILKSYGFKGRAVGEAIKEILRLKLDENIDELEALKKILKGDRN